MKITGIKKAVGDYKKVYGNSQKYGRLMYNTKTGKVWTSERYNQDMVYYEDENIVDITSDVESFYFEDEYPTNGYETNVTMKHVRAVIERYYMAGEVA